MGTALAPSNRPLDGAVGFGAGPATGSIASDASQEAERWAASGCRAGTSSGPRGSDLPADR